LLAATACLALGVTSQAASINVQFGCQSGSSCNGSGGSTSAQTGAAVVGSAGDYWNMAASQNGSGSLSSLLDTSGNATSVNLTYSAYGQWNEHDTSGANNYYNDTAFHGTPYENLMASYLVAGSGNSRVSLTGLIAGGEYSLYFYTQANKNTDGRIVDFNANGVTTSTTQIDPDNLNTFVLGQNYAFADTFADGSGNLTITFNSGSSYEGDFNGFQLIGGGAAAAPEPSTAGLMLLALGAGVRFLRRR
jgi:hypothetical protein